MALNECCSGHVFPLIEISDLLSFGRVAAHATVSTFAATAPLAIIMCEQYAVVTPSYKAHRCGLTDRHDAAAAYMH